MPNTVIRRAAPGDAEALHALYYPHLSNYPPKEPQDMARWSELIRKFETDERYNILVAEADGAVAASVTVTIIENLTHNMRPYALIENVVTHSDYRKRGIATALMNRACELAESFGCYKVMLMTGSKLESTLNFYRQCGFDGEEKTGFIKHFEE
ncbi:MAG: GNAT family N-acetyltransferase [Oscillospiraceae bacterium]|jgi:GNAT superfamily N-acetyltransferase|nr:GNAT family N-acetyltransferase [Oscillospiraceae bacterium]